MKSLEERTKLMQDLINHASTHADVSAADRLQLVHMAALEYARGMGWVPNLGATAREAELAARVAELEGALQRVVDWSNKTDKLCQYVEELDDAANVLRGAK